MAVAAAKLESLNKRLANADTSTESEAKKKGFQLTNPISLIRYHRAKVKFEEDSRLLRKDESMKQNVERFLMECEERHSWVAYELNFRNLVRLQWIEYV